MKIKLNFNIIAIFFFFFYFIIGILITKDYPVTPDEPLHRINVFISLKYIFNFFLIDFKSNIFFDNLPNLYADWRKTYGVLFDLPLAFIEYIFKIEDVKNVFLLRHYITYIIFFIGTIYFYFLIKNIKKNSIYPFVGVLILISTPRIFSHSFYNSKDIIFLSLMIISVFYSTNLLKTFEYKTLFKSALFCALASNVRIIGIYLPIITFLFYYLSNSQKKKISIPKFFLTYFFVYFISLYLIWPYLWFSPIDNLLTIITESTNYPAFWSFEVIYLGNYINPENLPWHYFFIWFATTTPPIFLLLILFGILYFVKEYFAYFLKINLNSDFSLWKNENQMMNLFFFLIFFIPLFLVICLNSTLYNGWRHLYFLYPFLIVLSLEFLNYFKLKKYFYIYKLFLLVIFFQCFLNLYFIYKSHPVQNVYFNSIFKNYVKDKLPIDYWGVGNKTTVDYLLTKDENVKLSVASYSNLFNITSFTKNNKKSYNENLVIFGTAKKFKNNSDYIFTNYFYDRNPINIESYRIPEGFHSYYKLIIDDILVNEVFKK